MQTKIKMRKRPASISTLLFNIDTSSNNVYYSLLLLFIPFRNEFDLLQEPETIDEAFLRSHTNHLFVGVPEGRIVEIATLANRLIFMQSQPIPTNVDDGGLGQAIISIDNQALDIDEELRRQMLNSIFDDQDDIVDMGIDNSTVNQPAVDERKHMQDCATLQYEQKTFFDTVKNLVTLQARG